MYHPAATSLPTALQDINVAAEEVDEADDSDAELDDLTAAAAAAGDTDTGAPSQAAVPAASAVAAAAAGRLSGPVVQLLISSCWMTWKEASLLIGTLAYRLPLPRNYGYSSSTGEAVSQPDAAPSTSGQRCRSQQQLLECQQLECLGALQLSMLLCMKHNGAVEKSQAGFIALVERLLESPEPCLNLLPRAWLARCLNRVQEPGQCRDDIVRRSAGVCVCEREGVVVGVCVMLVVVVGGGLN